MLVRYQLLPTSTGFPPTVFQEMGAVRLEAALSVPVGGAVAGQVTTTFEPDGIAVKIGKVLTSRYMLLAPLIVMVTVH